ncbi:hypothetical protein [Sphingobacterium tabacisoli]|uniref:Uncharacterized protein n=1 Tax=Sphingobacterium tabacisoli TaxID=2044855 RepID=A0ABW5L5I4_9SPHI|nr:hypothetical protein [Sphingobacterium tabacisoli]
MDEKRFVSTVADDTLLSSDFPHGCLPHYVWIYQRDKVVAFTRAEEISHENITQVLEKGNDTTFKRKRDYKIAYDYSELFLLGVMVLSLLFSVFIQC